MAAPISRTRPAMDPASKSGSPIIGSRGFRQPREHALDVATSKQLHVDPGMVGTQQAKFPILPRITYRLLDGKFNVKVVFGKIKIRCEKLDGLAALAPNNRKRPGLILPGDSIEVEQPCEFCFARVRE